MSDKQTGTYWDLCLLAQTLEFSDDVRTLIARGATELQRVTEERDSLRADAERCAHLAGELQALRNHVAHWGRGGIDEKALARADSALQEFAKSAAGGKGQA